MNLEMRPYHPSDLVALYRICLLTGDSGQDASKLFKDPDILGHYYAAPYTVFEPELCFVLTCSGKPSGYILGTSNSARFWEWCEKAWFPILREQYPLPDIKNTSYDAHIIRLFYNRQIMPNDLLPYPAHLHIDLLPAVQHRGMGRQLIQVFLQKLKELKVPAVHLQVGKRNTGAIHFYSKVGFTRISEEKNSIAFGKRLVEKSPERYSSSC
ncbi:GNAT family N-acetyltransferase [candidate division KSB1 bacterium]|nr:GNAT family N-acetyltransferase [candidate division KSB1 bacterium]